ncbi:MAG: hypothetical protein HY702_00115 [Gemmatimonadetes bacterium]|nr:hypothetical protein [Gemmatimonadota bacterium]
MYRPGRQRNVKAGVKNGVNGRSLITPSSPMARDRAGLPAGGFGEMGMQFWLEQAEAD